ncbi:hypothetical protein KP509_17G043000 [Ceratopteris richardii]|nr:hypothetical protein KP509_17G043000 [Ceratopteris richardii]
MRLFSNRKARKLSEPISHDWSNATAILQELKYVPIALEELLRVMSEAENYLHICRDSEWWRPGIVVGFTTEVRDVHIHDLMWCIAGLKLALQAVRGVELESRAQFTRLNVAQCYAEMGDFCSGTSGLSICEEQDSAYFSSALQQAMWKYEGMNFVRKMVMSGHEKIKYGMLNFLSQRLRAPFHTLEDNIVPAHVGKLPQPMRIPSEDLTFASPIHSIMESKYSTSHEGLWHGIRVMVKRFDYHSQKDYFLFEATVHVRLQCPFVIDLYGWSVDTHDYTCYLVFELVNCNLATLINNRKDSHKPLQLHVVIDLMLQLSRALEYLHNKGILHKDIRPDNVLVQPSRSCPELAEKGYGRVKLCNFGFDRWDLGPSQLNNLIYRAPEVWTLHEDNHIERLNYTFEADIYSFGMTFAFCLMEETPLGSNVVKVSLEQVFKKEVSLNFPPSCPLILKDLLLSCTSKRLEDRPSSSSITMVLRHLKLLTMKSSICDEHSIDREYFSSMPVISYAELCNATTDFSSSVQNISLHSMYHGVLSDGTKVLVQQVEGIINMRTLWFQTSQLLNLRHSNVAGLRAVCINASQCWFVIENSSVHGSLDKWLEDESIEEYLDVAICYRIAIGTACGLQYLHSHGIVYGISPENILLGEHYEPQLLVWSVQCEDVDEDLHYLHRLDVVQFGTLITKLLSYLTRSNSIGDASTANYQVYILKVVENLCLNAQMDEVVEVLESVYDCYHDKCYTLGF